jgi:MOSC domain-containing protein YiiM
MRVVAGDGVEGDRYSVNSREFRGERRPDRELTLIEAEAILHVKDTLDPTFEPASARRNVVTSGIRLNELVGKEFQVGEVLLEGMRLCHPCSHLESMTHPGVLKTLEGRGGLRARVVRSGWIAAGDRVVTAGPRESSAESDPTKGSAHGPA